MSIDVAELRLRPYHEVPRPHDLLGWFVSGFLAEVPIRTHARHTGASLLGSARVDGQFRALLEDERAFEDARLAMDDTVLTEQAYRFPMRAALHMLAGEGRADAPYPFMARVLYRTAWLGGDWDRACATLGILEQVRRPYVYGALERLFDRYRHDPAPRPLRRRVGYAVRRS